MHIKLSAFVLLLGAFSFTQMAQAQTAPNPLSFSSRAVDLAVTYTPQYAKVTYGACDCFWFQGGAADASITLYRGFGLAADLTGQTASGLAGGGSISKIDYLVGPRYTFSPFRREKHNPQVFGEALFGGVHGFDGTFPATTGATATANSFAYQLGVGFDVPLARGFGLRALEIDYVHTGLPDGGSDTQNDLRLAFGVSYRMGKH